MFRPLEVCNVAFLGFHAIYRQHFIYFFVVVVCIKNVVSGDFSILTHLTSHFISLTARTKQQLKCFSREYYRKISLCRQLLLTTKAF